jgi:hypothetical protein
VPEDILADLPIATDISEVAQVAFQNQQIRDRVNALIGDFAKATIAQQKRALKEAALQSADDYLDLFDGLLHMSGKGYNPTEDRAGIYALRQALTDIPVRYPFAIDAPKARTQTELERIVLTIVDQFTTLVEKNDISDLLWSNGTPRKEKAAQLVFYAVAEAYCRANNIDISPETDSGGGPVDFKFSTGYSGRYLVEIKLSTGSVVHGYEKQLEVYREATGNSDALFLVVDVGRMGGKMQRICRIQQQRQAAGERASEIRVVDARRRPPASKR